MQKEFRAESKRLLDLMINSIYTHKEIFLRELISNASDAIDKIYYRALTDESITFNQDDYYITIRADKDNRVLEIKDTGIGMTKDELEENLGVIANSGSFAFKKENDLKDGFDIIGQFGVGFYSAFMVAEKVTVISKALDSEQAYRWESSGADGYSIEECEKYEVGTTIILKIKENTEEESYSEYLDEYRLRSIIKKHSDFIRYPIKMEVTKSREKEEGSNEYEEYKEDEVINSMVPLWRKNKSELTTEDYENFYSEKHYGFDKPLKHIHISADGAVRYNSILFIPEKTPFDFYTKEYEKGLELYANGVLIMSKCKELIPDHFSFVKGMVDSEDLTLNISREMLQHDRQLKLIAKNLKNKIRNELKTMLKNDRESYEKFYESFGKQLKYGVYSEFGKNKEDLQDLLMFYSSTEEKMVSLEEYVSRMKEDQKYIYYATGENYDRIKKLPQTEMVSEKGFEILYFIDDIDEFAIKMLMTYKEKEFKSISSGDLGIETEEEKKESLEEAEKYKALFEEMKNILKDKVKDVVASRKLKNHPVCLSNDGEISIEMEKILSAMPDAQGVKADKILEINITHDIATKLNDMFVNDKAKLAVYTELLYGQALLIEGLSVEDPVEFANKMCQVMI